MKVYKRNVYLGSKVVYNIADDDCEFFSKIIAKAFGKKIATNVIFIKVDEDTFVDLNDILSSPIPKHLAIRSATKYKRKPTNACDVCAGGLKPYYKLKTADNNEKIELNEIKEKTYCL